MPHRIPVVRCGRRRSAVDQYPAPGASRTHRFTGPAGKPCRPARGAVAGGGVGDCRPVSGRVVSGSVRVFGSRPRTWRIRGAPAPGISGTYVRRMPETRTGCRTAADRGAWARHRQRCRGRRDRSRPAAQTSRTGCLAAPLFVLSAHRGPAPSDRQSTTSVRKSGYLSPGATPREQARALMSTP